MSPYQFNSYGSMRIYTIESSGSFLATLLNVSAGVRPVISLKSYTPIANGSGTMADPYVISTS